MEGNTKTQVTMADIRIGLQGIAEPDRSIGLILDEFYRNMKALDFDPHRGGKQATLIIMTMNDILDAVKKHPPTP